MYHSSALFASRRDRRVGVKACSRSNPRNEIKSGCAGLLPKLMMLLLSFVIYPVENVRLARHTRSTQRLPSPAQDIPEESTNIKQRLNWLLEDDLSVQA